MGLLNVAATGLNGKPHHILEGVFSTYDIRKSGDWEDVRHILCECDATTPARDEVFPKLMDFITEFEPAINWVDLHDNKASLVQFVTDPCSLNLQNNFRFPLNHPHLPTLMSLLRDLCYRCHSLRTKSLNAIKVKRSM